MITEPMTPRRTHSQYLKTNQATASKSTTMQISIEKIRRFSNVNSGFDRLDLGAAEVA